MAERADLLALCYHGVRPRPVSHRDVTPPTLRRQLELLLERGYRGCTFHDAIGARGRGRILAVTFDDGDGSVFEHAYPVLADLGVPATVFVAPDAVGASGGVTWDELDELARAGWEIGSHTNSHPVLTDLEDGELGAELRESKERVEVQLGRPCLSLAYPFGKADERVIRATARAGYAAACVVSGALAADTPLAWPRVGVGAADGMLVFRMKIAPPIRRFRGSRLGRAISRRRDGNRS